MVRAWIDANSKGFSLSTITLTRWTELRDAYRRKELRQALYGNDDGPLRDCLLNLHGTEHRDRRRLENRLFRREVFEHWEYDVLGPAVSSILAPFVAAGEGDLVNIGYRLAMNLTATIAGLDVDPADPTQTDTVHRLTSKLSEGATMAHSTRDRDELLREVEAAFDELDNDLLQPAIAARGGGECPRHDVLSVLLANEDKLGLTHEMVLREIGFYLQAGAHSTANALVHSFDLLFHWLPSQAMTPADAAEDLELLQRVVHEGLRLWPASPVALRRATAACDVTAGISVDEGDLVEFDLMSANRDPDIFGTDANDFNPNRSLPDGIPLWGNSFGGGIHTCIGQELDGGVPPDENSTGRPLYGTVAIMLKALLDDGFVPDAHRPPEELRSSTRAHHGNYWVTRTSTQGEHVNG